VEWTGASCPAPAARRLWWEVPNRFLWGLRGSVNTYGRLVSQAPPDLSSLLEPLESYRAITRNATLWVAVQSQRVNQKPLSAYRYCGVSNRIVLIVTLFNLFRLQGI
jgi:hypothetical protein